MVVDEGEGERRAVGGEIVFDRREDAAGGVAGIAGEVVDDAGVGEEGMGGLRGVAGAEIAAWLCCSL